MLFKYLRGGGAEHFPSRSEQGYVRLDDVADIVKFGVKFGREQLLPVPCVPCAAFQQRLYSRNPGCHHAEHVGLVPLVHEYDAHRSHAGQDEE